MGNERRETLLASFASETVLQPSAIFKVKGGTDKKDNPSGV